MHSSQGSSTPSLKGIVEHGCGGEGETSQHKEGLCDGLCKAIPGSGGARDEAEQR